MVGFVSAAWAIVTWATSAHTPEPSPRLTIDWHAPAGCPDAATAEAVIAERAADAIGETPLHVRVDVREHATGWRVLVELDGEAAQGTRELDANTCEDALRATAVVIGIAVDPHASTDAPSTSPVTVPGPTAGEAGAARDPAEPPARGPSRVPETRSSTDRPPPPREDRAARFAALGVAAGPDVGAVPRLGAVLRGSVAAGAEHWFVRGSAIHRVERSTVARAVDGAERRGRFRMTAGQLAAGARWAWGKIELPVHAGVELGVTWARGAGVDVRPTTSRRLWSAAILGLGVAYAPIRRLALRVEAEGTVPLTRPEFVLGDVDIATIRRAGIRAWLGIELRIFPYKRRPSGIRPPKR